jgi:hypothetical protein
VLINFQINILRDILTILSIRDEFVNDLSHETFRHPNQAAESVDIAAQHQVDELPVGQHMLYLLAHCGN